MNSIRDFIQKNVFYFSFLLLYVVYFILAPNAGHGWDNYCWVEWSKFMFTEGLAKVYNSWTDYLPLYHYILYFFGLLQGSVEAIQQNIYFLRIITFAFDIAAGFVIVRLLNERFNSQVSAKMASFYFLNYCIFFNTLVWGQVDSIMSFFVLLAFYAAYKKRVSLSLLWFIIAFNFKLQSIIFLPFIGLLLLPTIQQQCTFKRLLQWIFVPIIVQIIILSPFIYSNSVDKILDVISNSFGKYPKVSMNAYNLWYLFFDGDLMQISDTEKLGFISYNKLGLLLFFVVSFFTLFPLLKSVYFAIKNKCSVDLSLDKMLIIGALIPLSFFYFNTQMHERYSHPAFVFLLTYCILNKKIFIGVLSSFAYLLNLEGVLRYFHISETHFIFTPMQISIMFLVVILLLMNDLYGDLLRINRLQNVIKKRK